VLKDLGLNTFEEAFVDYAPVLLGNQHVDTSSVIEKAGTRNE
jgi:hypothetical protein